jgi:hypothetical protein
MVSIQILKSASIVIQVIEETLAGLDPYNQDFPEEPNYSIGNCEFPDQIEDPFALVRELRGDAFAKNLEYEDHIEFILQTLNDCLLEELNRRGIRAAEELTDDD